jgi:hypothetical protein
MDTLIYTATTFIIPINIAAYNRKYVLMNVFILLTLTSWAHHSIVHTQQSVYTPSIYDDIDKIMCFYAIYFSFMYALFFTSIVKFILYSICLTMVIVSYIYVHRNVHYAQRGLINWHHHKYHIIMHLSACLGFIVISF